MSAIARVPRLMLAAALVAAAIAVSTPAAPAAEPATRPARLSADRVPLDVFLDTLRSSVDGLNLSINWPALEAVGVDRSTPVTLRLRGASLRKVLDLALRQAGEGRAAWYVDGNVVVVTSRELADRAMVTRVYPVRDLIVRVPDFKPPTVNLDNGGGDASLVTGTTDANNTDRDTAAERGERLADLVRTLIRPEIWIENGGYASVRYFAGNLIVTAPRDVQNQIGH